MKSEKAMSHITVIICILILIAIAILGIRFFLHENENRIINNLTTDMLLLQGKVKVLSQENEMNSEEHPLIGTKVADSIEDEKIKSMLEKKVINQEDENFNSYYIIDGSNMKELKLVDNPNGEYYIVNYKTYEIIYVKGIEIDGSVKYTLTQLLEYNDKQEEKKIDESSETTNSEESVTEETIEDTTEETEN